MPLDRQRHDPLRAFIASQGRRQRLARHALLHQAGEQLACVALLEQGWIARVRMDPAGNSAFNALHIAGDLVGVDAWPGTPFGDDLLALTRVSVVKVPARAIRSAATADAVLAMALADFLAIENGLLREALFAVGRKPSMERLCTFFLQAHQRMVAAGLIEETSRRFELPLTQGELATATGLTAVHVNRTLKFLRNQGWLKFRSGMVELLDADAVEAQAQRPPMTLS